LKRLRKKISPCCDLHLGDSRLQFISEHFTVIAGCDLHLGDSRLQSTRDSTASPKCKSQHCGEYGDKTRIVTDYRLNANHN
jgi:hypothetical protein